MVHRKKFVYGYCFARVNIYFSMWNGSELIKKFDCLMIPEVNNIILNFFNFELQLSDRCSTYICHTCFHKLMDFKTFKTTVILNQSTIKETQEITERFFNSLIKIEGELPEDFLKTETTIPSEFHLQDETLTSNKADEGIECDVDSYEADEDTSTDFQLVLNKIKKETIKDNLTNTSGKENYKLLENNYTNDELQELISSVRPLNTNVFIHPSSSGNISKEFDLSKKIKIKGSKYKSNVKKLDLTSINKLPQKRSKMPVLIQSSKKNISHSLII